MSSLPPLLITDLSNKEYVDIEDVEEYLPKLSKDNLKIIMLRSKGHTYQEIATEFGKSISWVKLKMKRIIGIVRYANDYEVIN